MYTSISRWFLRWNEYNEPECFSCTRYIRHAVPLQQGTRLDAKVQEEGEKGSFLILAVTHVTTGIIAHLKNIQDAPQERVNFLVELAGLHTVLCIFRQRVEGSKLGEKWLVGVQELSTKGGPLDQLTSDLRRLESMLAPVSKLREVGRRIAWKFNKAEIEDILTGVERTKTLISLALANDQYSLSRAIKEDCSQIEFTVQNIQMDYKTNCEEEEFRKIVEWLSPLNFRTSQNDIFQKREDGTGLWLLESKEFKAWKKGNSGMLWCPGMPAAGKTVLSSMVVNYLQQSAQYERIAIVCAYCSYKEQATQTASNLIASLLKQVIQDSSPISDDIKSIYRSSVRSDIRPTIEELLKTLSSECRRFSKVFIVVDALDECRDDNGTRPKVVEALKSLASQANIMVTSRDLPTIARDFQGATRLDIRAHDQDVRRYIDRRIDRAARAHLSKLREQVVNRIVDNSRGMFLLAKLHMDSLVGKHNTAAIHRALENLPKGMNDSYDEAMGRIEGQNEDDKSLSKAVLLWITFARRPLFVEELQHALAVTPGMKTMDLDEITDDDVLVSVCAGLVVVDGESGIIRLVHYTTQQYFESRREYIFPDAQARITRTCLTYLSFDGLGERNFDDEEIFSLLKANPLLEYAALYWGDHARGQAEEQCRESALEFLRNLSSYACASVVFMLKYPFFGHTSTPSAIHLCSFFGLTHLIKHLLDSGTASDVRDGFGRTPLCWAAQNGNNAVVTLLVAREDVDVNSKDNLGRTPLSWAVATGHHEVVDTLLRCKDVDAKMRDEGGRSLLHIAAGAGSETLVTLILACRDVEVNQKEILGKTALHWAASMGHAGVVKLLLERHDIDMNSVDKNGQTPLHCAARSGHAGVIELLLARSEVDMNPKPGKALPWSEVNVDLVRKSKIPPHFATRCGQANTIKLPLGSNAVRVNAKDNEGLTPLFYAATEGHEEVVRLLVSQEDVDVNLRENNSLVALHFAACRGRTEVVRLLLTRNELEVNAKDELGLAPIHCAAHKGRNEVVKLLLSRGDIDFNSGNPSGQTPLDLAKDGGHDAVARMLIDCLERPSRI